MSKKIGRIFLMFSLPVWFFLPKSFLSGNHELNAMIYPILIVIITPCYMLWRLK